MDPAELLEVLDDVGDEAGGEDQKHRPDDGEKDAEVDPPAEPEMAKENPSAPTSPAAYAPTNVPRLPGRLAVSGLRPPVEFVVTPGEASTTFKRGVSWANGGVIDVAHPNPTTLIITMSGITATNADLVHTFRCRQLPLPVEPGLHGYF